MIPRKRSIEGIRAEFCLVDITTLLSVGFDPVWLQKILQPKTAVAVIYCRKISVL